MIVGRGYDPTVMDQEVWGEGNVQPAVGIRALIRMAGGRK